MFLSITDQWVQLFIQNYGAHAAMLDGCNDSDPERTIYFAGLQNIYYSDFSLMRGPALIRQQNNIR